MKTKRILAIAMAMVMTFVVFAIPTSAVTGYFLKPIVSVEGGNTTVAAGDTVKITFALETEQTYNKWNGGVFSLAWDNTKIDYADSMAYAGTWATVMDTTSLPNTAASAITNVTWSTADQAKGYNDGFKMAVAETTSDYSLTDGEVLLTFDFKVAEGLAAGTEIYVGIADGMYAGAEPGFYLTPDSSWGFPILDDETDWNMSDYGMGSYDKSASYVKLTVAAAKKVFHKATQIQWNNQAENIVNLGFKGYFNAADIAIAFGETGKSSNVTAVGAKITAANSDTKSTRWVYTPDNGTTYEFRAILPVDLDTDANTTITVEYFVTYNGETYWSEPVTTTASAHTSRLPA